MGLGMMMTARLRRSEEQDLDSTEDEGWCVRKPPVWLWVRPAWSRSRSAVHIANHR